MEDNKKFSCSLCSVVWQKSGSTNCWNSDPEGGPKKPAFCPTHENAALIEKAAEFLKGDSEDAKMARVAGVVEGLCYEPLSGSTAINARWTRVEDTIAFMKLMGYLKIGLATCIGLLDETNRLAQILSAQGFEPMSICCKTGSVDKLELGLMEKDKIRPGTFEPACNPIAQARLFNGAGTDMNIIVGLCVGHDILFTKHCDAPVTTLVVKDRVTGHNPVSVLYGQNFYYKRLLSQQVDVSRRENIMSERMKNCWEFKNCEREKGGRKVKELGECIASIEGLGHSCWAIAGTLCGGAVQGSIAQKEKNCMTCEVYNLYHRVLGSEGKRIAAELPEEQKRYNDMRINRMKKK